VVPPGRLRSRPPWSDEGEGVKPARWVGDLAGVAILTGVYFVAGKLGLMLALVNPSASAVWPPTGIALAALLLVGYRVWPGILIGAFLVNVTTAGSVATSLGIAAGNTLEALVAAHLANRLAGGRRAFDGPQGVVLFVVLAGLAMTVKVAGPQGLACADLTELEFARRQKRRGSCQHCAKGRSRD